MVHLPFVDHLALNLEATKKTVVGRGCFCAVVLGLAHGVSQGFR